MLNLLHLSGRDDWFPRIDKRDFETPFLGAMQSYAIGHRYTEQLLVRAVMIKLMGSGNQAVRALLL